jgi:hypothetical protein
MYAASGENARLQDGDHADGRARGYVLTCDEQVISTTVVSFFAQVVFEESVQRRDDDDMALGEGNKLRLNEKN